MDAPPRIQGLFPDVKDSWPTVQLRGSGGVGERTVGALAGYGDPDRPAGTFDADKHTGDALLPSRGADPIWGTKLTSTKVWGQDPNMLPTKEMAYKYYLQELTAADDEVLRWLCPMEDHSGGPTFVTFKTR